MIVQWFEVQAALLALALFLTAVFLEIGLRIAFYHSIACLLSVYRNIGAGSELLYRHTGWQPTGGLRERLIWEAEKRGPTEYPAAELPVSRV